MSWKTKPLSDFYVIESKRGFLLAEDEESFMWLAPAHNKVDNAAHFSLERVAEVARDPRAVTGGLPVTVWKITVGPCSITEAGNEVLPLVKHALRLRLDRALTSFSDEDRKLMNLPPPLDTELTTQQRLKRRLKGGGTKRRD